MFRFCGLSLLAVLAVSNPAAAQQAIQRNGSCPTGYNASGNYCVPSYNARPVIERNGSCPTGYNASGNYCVIDLPLRFSSAGS